MGFRIKSLRLVDDKLVVQFEEKMIPRCAEGVVVEGRALEVRGWEQTGGYTMEDVGPITASVQPGSLLDQAWQLVERVSS